MGGSGRDDRRDDGERGGAATGDRVAAAAGELYGADPQGFTDRRGELAAAARAAGDRAAAKAIGALRRPTRAAWVVNRLARTDPSAAPKLAELAAALRAAQEAGHGPRLREMSAARGALVDALTNQALRTAGVPDPPASLREEVSGTLTAAVADPGVAKDFAAGTLTRAVQWSGFGLLPAAQDEGAGEDTDTDTVRAGSGPAVIRPEPAGTADGSAEGPAAADAAAEAGKTAGAPAGTGRGRAERDVDETAASRTEPEAAVPRPRGAESATARGRARHGAGRADRADREAAAREAAARRQAEEEERRAREAAERTARRREQYEEAARGVAASAAAAADAVSAEDRLEAEVRDLEQRLTRARAELAAARMRARHAEAAERRARQALDRLPRDLPEKPPWPLMPLAQHLPQAAVFGIKSESADHSPFCRWAVPSRQQRAKCVFEKILGLRRVRDARSEFRAL